MKQVSANGAEVLLARVGGKVHAVAAYCPHYGAPLVDGVLSGDRVVCPWHHSCFDITTGDLQEPPAIDALPSYEVRIEDDQVIVSLPAGGQDRRTPKMSKRYTRDERLFVIIGGGAAGYSAAQTLREDGFTGHLVLIASENRLPYDRPNLSKEYLQGSAEPAWLPLRPEDFFAENDIEVHVQIVIHNYRWRLGIADGEAKYDDLEKRLAAGPAISVPTITMEGDAHGAPHPDASSYAKKFSGKYSHRTIGGGIGHNVPQEAPKAFAEAIVEVDGY